MCMQVCVCVCMCECIHVNECVRVHAYQLGVSPAVQDEVLRLQVSVDDALLVQVAESHGDLCQVETTQPYYH